MATRILSNSATPNISDGTRSSAGHTLSDESARSSGRATTPGKDEKLPKHSIGRAVLVAVFAATIVSVILLAFSWPTVTADPKDLPIAAVGDQKQIDQVVANAPEGMLDLTSVDSRDEAVRMIKERKAYGAFVLGEKPEVLTASAASPAVSQQLSAIGTQMQEKIDGQAISGLQEGNKQMQKALAAAASGQPGPQENAPSDGQGADASAMEAPHVTITDVVPLSEDDPSGAGLAIAGLPLTIGGIVGGVLTSMLVHSRRMRAVSVIVYGAVGGVALALILQSWFGILQGNFGLNVLAAGLAIASTAGLINGFVSLIGSGGIAIGAVLTMFIGNPIASLNQPKEFLAGSWGDIGQFFVPGASGALLRDLSYFPDAVMTAQWWALIGWFVLGIVLILVGHLKAHSKKQASLH